MMFESNVGRSRELPHISLRINKKNSRRKAVECKLFRTFAEKL